MAESARKQAEREVGRTEDHDKTHHHPQEPDRKPGKTHHRPHSETGDERSEDHDKGDGNREEKK